MSEGDTQHNDPCKGSERTDIAAQAAYGYAMSRGWVDALTSFKTWRRAFRAGAMFGQLVRPEGEDLAEARFRRETCSSSKAQTSHPSTASVETDMPAVKVTCRCPSRRHDIRANWIWWFVPEGNHGEYRAIRWMCLKCKAQASGWAQPWERNADLTRALGRKVKSPEARRRRVAGGCAMNAEERMAKARAARTGAGRRKVPSRKEAIDAFCKQCIYDPQSQGLGSWRRQVADCTAKRCPLYPVRPMPIGEDATEGMDDEGDKE